MPYTLQGLIQIAADRLGFHEEGMSTVYNGAMVVNMAGRQMVESRNWNFRKMSVTITLDEAASQVELPGAVELFSVDYPLSTVANFRTMPYIEVLRYQRVGLSSGFVVPVALQNLTTNEEGSMRPFLVFGRELEAGTSLLVIYRTGWVELENDTDIAQVPTFMENLLVQFVREVAVGLEEPDEVPFENRMGALAQGLTYQNAVREDSRSVRSSGPVTNGASMLQGLAGRAPFDGYINGTIQGPS